MKLRVLVILLSFASLAISATCTASEAPTEKWQNEWTILPKSKTPVSEEPTLIRDGLILDLDADKDVTLEDGNMVTNWKNQVAEFPAQDFSQRDKGRDIPGSGRPTLKENIAELGGHNSLIFWEDELINMNKDAFDHLITGSGYTWFTVMNAYAQVGRLKDVSVFFGNLNCDDRLCEGFWAGFEDDGDLWTGPRNGITFGRYNADNPKLLGPRFEEDKYYVVAGRLAAGTGTVLTEVFVDSAVPYGSVEFPVNPNANASVMAIGTERDAWQHPGQESFDGELARVLIYERALTDEEMAWTMFALKSIYFGGEDHKPETFGSDGPTALRVEQDEAAGTISVFRADGKEAIVTQNAKPNFRPFLHPIVAPDGKGLLTEYSPGHHEHQTGLYWGFTRVNGRDYFHHPESDYWQRASASVLQATGEEVMWQTVYNMLDERGHTILTETQRWSMREQDGKYLLDLEWNGTAKADVTIGEYDYGGLFLRMPWREGIRGQAINAARQVNAQAEGQRADWVDVAMQVEGREDLAHIAIFDHPSNAGYPQAWRVDGQLGIGPARARLGDWKIEKGKTETIRHQIVAYTGDYSDIELSKLWQKYSR
jgi:hypothetical protein